MTRSAKNTWLCLAALTALLLSGAAFVSWAQDAVFPKIEASFNVAGLSTNPIVLFDYSQTDIEVAILQPDSSTILLPAFYDGGTTWRVRHTPGLAVF